MSKRHRGTARTPKEAADDRRSAASQFADLGRPLLVNEDLVAGPLLKEWTDGHSEIRPSRPFLAYYPGDYLQGRFAGSIAACESFRIAMKRATKDDLAQQVNAAVHLFKPKLIYAPGVRVFKLEVPRYGNPLILDEGEAILEYFESKTGKRSELNLTMTLATIADGCYSNGGSLVYAGLARQFNAGVDQLVLEPVRPRPPQV